MAQEAMRVNRWQKNIGWPKADYGYLHTACVTNVALAVRPGQWQNVVADGPPLKRPFAYKFRRICPQPLGRRPVIKNASAI